MGRRLAGNSSIGGWRAVLAPLVMLAFGAAAAADNAAFVWHLPRGFPTPAVPADNPMSTAKVALGRRLFFEPRLSVTGQYSCASCHEPARAYTDGRALAVGATGQPLVHSAMSLVNVAYNISFGWTKPEVQSLEQQMLEPLLNEHPVELGLAGREAAVCALLAEDPEYRAAFAEAFAREAGAGDRARTGNGRRVAPSGDNATAGAAASIAAAPTGDAATVTAAVPDPITFNNIVKAIAAFERTLNGGASPFDRYVFGGDHDALSPQAKRGMQLFYSPKAGCGTCHSGFNFNGNWRDSQGTTGKAAFASNGLSDLPMRVPTLRNIALTAPYMHDGRFNTLAAVLEHYSSVAQLPTSDPKLRTFDLSPEERADVIAFLQALTDSELPGR
ncbi:MAG: c-type cytochrome [Proteobacteria bacterium]|nr:c-type cytochrome [Pseudomonadota bacterium]